MPVTFRQPFAQERIKTRIGVLGDRYREVREALTGWNNTGVPLVGQINSAWFPIPCGDDTGLFYLVPLVARKTGLDTDASLNLFLFGIIFASAIAATAGLWLISFGTRQRLFLLVPVLAGSWLSYKVGDLYVVPAALALALVPWLMHALGGQISTRRRLLIVFIAGIFLGFGQWLRSQSSAPLLVFFAVLLCFSPIRRRSRLLVALAMGAGLSLPLLYAQLPLHERDRFLAQHDFRYASLINRHLVWHTAYLGLAYRTNPYVSAWNDTAAVEYVQSIDPSAIYGGQEYEHLLRARVKDIARRDPEFVILTVAAKAGALLWMLLLSINVGLAAAISRPKPIGIELGLSFAIAVAALPGVVALPAPTYVSGMIMLALYYWYWSIRFYFERSTLLRLWKKIA